MFGFNWEEHKMRQKTDQKFYLGSWGGKFSLLLFAKAESAMILFGPFQNAWVESGQLTWNLCCINMSKYVTATGPKKWGSTHAACSCPPPPQAGCRNSGMQADVRANTGQWGMRLSRREKSGRYWIVKESALRKLSQNMWQQHHVFACPPKGLIFKEYQK